MNKNKLNMKDFMNIGIFTALYFILMLVCALILGYTPITFLMIPALAAFVTGIPMMIFYARVKKFGIALGMGVVYGIICVLIGRGVHALPLCVVLALIGEGLLKSGNYRSSWCAALANAVFSINSIATYLPMYYASESFLKTAEEGYGQNYAQGLQAFTSPWVLCAMIASAFIFGILGGLLGGKIFKKHFERSGVV